jgi:hypothetical protein
MKGNMIRKGNVTEMVEQDTLWQDPMCYPAFNKESLLGKARSVNKDHTVNSVENDTTKFAA